MFGRRDRLLMRRPVVGPKELRHLWNCLSGRCNLRFRRLHVPNRSVGALQPLEWGTRGLLRRVRLLRQLVPDLALERSRPPAPGSVERVPVGLGPPEIGRRLTPVEMKASRANPRRRLEAEKSGRPLGTFRLLPSRGDGWPRARHDGGGALEGQTG